MLPKNNTKAKTKRASKNGNDHNQPQTKKATKLSKTRNVLNLFFLLVGFGAIISGVLSLFIPTLVQAKGLYIVEPFSCEVALADYYHLTQSVKENNPQFIQEQLEESLQVTIEALAEHSECEGVRDGN
jgi:hypothetical protein